MTLEREFVKWFFEEPYPLEGSNRATVFGWTSTQAADARDYWMREAFLAGAQAQLGTLAAAVEGSK